MDFEWDEAKASSNREEPGVDFVDALEIFFDPLRLERRDDRLDDGEDCLQTVGLVKGRILFVVYTEREARIRLISARRATAKERGAYEDARR